MTVGGNSMSVGGNSRKKKADFTLDKKGNIKKMRGGTMTNIMVVGDDGTVVKQTIKGTVAKEDSDDEMEQEVELHLHLVNSTIRRVTFMGATGNVVVHGPKESVGTVINCKVVSAK